MTTSTPTMGLTDKEALVLQAFNDETYSLFEDGIKADSFTWTAVFISEVEKVLETTPAAASRIINKMIDKEYFDKDDSERHDTDGFLLKLTDNAVDAIASFRADDDLADDVDMLDVTVDDVVIARTQHIDVEPGTPDDEVLDALEELDDDDEAEPTTMVQAAAKARKAKVKKNTADLRKAALEDVKVVANRRTSHSDCNHAKSGTEGKTARAKCRKERAASAKADA